MNVAIVAPGKLFVVGEYAVLEGAPALVVAVDAGVRCEARPADREPRLVAPDLDVDLPLREAASDPRARLIARAAAAASERFGVAGGASLRVEGTHPASRRKLGLGGSAATVVAVCGACAALAGEDVTSPGVRATLFEVGRRVHLDHQGGRGSGADVAASVFGGWLAYEPGEGGARIVPLEMPEGLRLGVAWSGIARDTAADLAPPAGGADAPAAARRRPMPSARLRAILERFWGALAEGDSPALLREVSAYGDALDAGADGVPGAARVRELVAAASAARVAAKGSGAVGGDCVIALAFDPAALAAAEARWRELGAEVLRLAVDPVGVREEARHG